MKHRMFLDWGRLGIMAGGAFVCGMCSAGMVVGIADGKSDDLFAAWAVAVAGALAGIGCLVVTLRGHATVDDNGVTLRGWSSTNRVTWDELSSLEIEVHDSAWLVRAWCEDRPVIVARRTRAPQRFRFFSGWTDGEVFDSPPARAPRMIRRVWSAIEDSHDRSVEHA